MKPFFSYNFKDEHFVRRVAYYLRKQEGISPYCYADEPHLTDWPTEVGGSFEDSDAFVLFVGPKPGETQEKEGKLAILRAGEWSKAGHAPYRLVRIDLPSAAPLPTSLSFFKCDCPIVTVRGFGEKDADGCARQTVMSLGAKWVPPDDLPISYQFDYEKDIIAAYRKGELPGKLIEAGCPKEWPEVTKREGVTENLVGEDEIGLFGDWDYERNVPRDEEPRVFVAALADYNTGSPDGRKLTLPEARPRKLLHYPNRPGGALTVGVMVSGGIAPGINAVIAGVVERQFLYAERGGYRRSLTVNGYYNGLDALLRPATYPALLNPQMVKNQNSRGGSLLGTSRAPQFMDADPERRELALRQAVSRLLNDGTEILYIIGGDGTMRAAHALWKTAQDMGDDLSVVAIPRSVDNDILWVWQSFGFASAVEWSKGVIQQLHTEAESNPRLCVIQLFGSDSGFVVTHAVTASGVCDLFLIPEAPFTIKGISRYIEQKLREKYIDSGRISAYGVIVMAETAIPTDARNYLDDSYVGLDEDEKSAILKFEQDGRRVYGQTPDELRSAGLKLVSRMLQKCIRQMAGGYWQNFRVFTNEPRHLIRAIPPSSSDIIFAHRLGSLAVDCGMAGYTDFMISQWLTEYVMVPLRLVTLGRKRIPEYGIFYKSACASTGQPPSLT